MSREEILRNLCLDLMTTIGQLEFEADMERGYKYEMEHETKGEPTMKKLNGTTYQTPNTVTAPTIVRKAKSLYGKKQVLTIASAIREGIV